MYLRSAMVGMARRAVPARVVAGGTNIRATLAIEGAAPLHAARTSQRDVPTRLNRYGRLHSAKHASRGLATIGSFPNRQFKQRNTLNTRKETRRFVTKRSAGKMPAPWASRASTAKQRLGGTLTNARAPTIRLNH